ncbi:MAG TPA: type II toxin-antitoxin system PemK/MazF family toxin [Candidatus Handelsmanbacteria bacterium]|nr:type II toxin-antitoxin system PemK/MazF family toxin [Candidatus Handelsmanbacteria bacterium]
MPRYVPQKGDLITLSFDPQSGHEQQGRRPALVVSNDLFNRHTELAMVCPITNTDRKMPFHVPIPEKTNLTGFVMVEQIKSVDYVSRKAERIDKAPAELLEEVLGILDAVLY